MGLSDSGRGDEDYENQGKFFRSPDHNMINIWSRFAVSEILSCRNASLDYKQALLFIRDSVASFVASQIILEIEESQKIEFERLHNRLGVIRKR